jgi:hypothetical protein
LLNISVPFDLGRHKDKLESKHDEIKADFSKIFMLFFFVSLRGKVSRQERLLFDFASKVGDLEYFGEKVNLYQRDDGIFACVKAHLDAQQGVELDYWQLLAIG